MNSNEKNDTTQRPLFESASTMSRRMSSNATSDNRIESVQVFRDGLSAYSIATGKLSLGKNCVWSPENRGGVPLDYDPETNTVFADGSDAHTLLVGATGSKKSRLVVMPTVRILGDANESMVVCDPKAEIYHRTSGFLHQRGYNLYVINLRDPSKGDGWNILDIPFQLFLEGNIDKAYEYINDQAAALIPINSDDPYWDYSSRDLYVGLAMLLFELAKKYSLFNNTVNIQTLLRLKTDLFASTQSSTIMKSSLWSFAEQYDMIRTKLLGIVICPSNTMGCILSVFDQYLSCFSLQPQIINLLSETTLKLDRIGYDKTAVFLIMPDEKSTYHKLITVFIKQIYEYLIDQAFKECRETGFPRRVNFLLDEFSSLPTITDFPQMIAASRSRNIRFTIIVQSKHQMKQRYNDETETIQSNCANWLFLHSREVPLLQEVSTLAGNKGYQPLIPVSKLQHLDKEKGECLVFAGRLYPYIAKLADISVFDNNQFKEYPIPERKRVAVPTESFAKILDKEHTKSTPKPQQIFADPPPLVPSGEAFTDEDIDDLVERVDARIAELDAEKAAEEAKKYTEPEAKDLGVDPHSGIHKTGASTSDTRKSKPNFFIFHMLNWLKNNNDNKESEE